MEAGLPNQSAQLIINRADWLGSIIIMIRSMHAYQNSLLYVITIFPFLFLSSFFFCITDGAWENPSGYKHCLLLQKCLATVDCCTILCQIFMDWWNWEMAAWGWTSWHKPHTVWQRHQVSLEPAIIKLFIIIIINSIFLLVIVEASNEPTYWGQGGRQKRGFYT